MDGNPELVSRNHTILSIVLTEEKEMEDLFIRGTVSVESMAEIYEACDIIRSRILDPR